jgi:hypothetical protein
MEIQLFLGDFPLTKYLFLQNSIVLGDFPLTQYLFFKKFLENFLWKSHHFQELIYSWASYILIPENDDFLKGKCPSFACILEK